MKSSRTRSAPMPSGLIRPELLDNTPSVSNTTSLDRCMLCLSPIPNNNTTNARDVTSSMTVSRTSGGNTTADDRTASTNPVTTADSPAVFLPSYLPSLPSLHKCPEAATLSSCCQSSCTNLVTACCPPSPASPASRCAACLRGVDALCSAGLALFSRITVQEQTPVCILGISGHGFQTWGGKKGSKQLILECEQREEGGGSPPPDEMSIMVETEFPNGQQQGLGKNHDRIHNLLTSRRCRDNGRIPVSGKTSGKGPTISTQNTKRRKLDKQPPRYQLLTNFINFSTERTCRETKDNVTKDVDNNTASSVHAYGSDGSSHTFPSVGKPRGSGCLDTTKCDTIGSHTTRSSMTVGDALDDDYQCAAVACAALLPSTTPSVCLGSSSPSPSPRSFVNSPRLRTVGQSSSSNNNDSRSSSWLPFFRTDHPPPSIILSSGGLDYLVECCDDLSTSGPNRSWTPTSRSRCTTNDASCGRSDTFRNPPPDVNNSTRDCRSSGSSSRSRNSGGHAKSETGAVQMPIKEEWRVMIKEGKGAGSDGPRTTDKVSSCGMKDLGSFVETVYQCARCMCALPLGELQVHCDGHIAEDLQIMEDAWRPLHRPAALRRGSRQNTLDRYLKR